MNTNLTNGIFEAPRKSQASPSREKPTGRSTVARGASDGFAGLLNVSAKSARPESLNKSAAPDFDSEVGDEQDFSISDKRGFEPQVAPKNVKGSSRESSADPLSSLENGNFEARPEFISAASSAAIPSFPNPKDLDIDTRIAVETQAPILDSLKNRSALQKFIVQMKEQLGVQPSDIINAFGRLSPEELSQSPRDSMEVIISNLPIESSQVPLAKKLFRELIEATDGQNISGQIKAKDRRLTLAVLSQREARNKAMETSLAQMNQQFFAPPPQVLRNVNAAQVSSETPAPKGALSAQPYQNISKINSQMPQRAQASQIPVNTNELVEASGLNDVDEGTMALGNEWEKVAPEEFDASELVASVAPAKTASASSVETVAPKAIESSSSSIFSAMNIAKNPMPAAPAMAPNSTSAPLESPHVEMEAPEGAEFYEPSVPEMSSVAANGANAPVVASQSKDESMDQENSSTKGHEHMTVQDQNQKVDRSASGPEFVLPSKPSSEQMTTNLKDIANHAQTMVRQGGGEMKMKLQPEGLGEVLLKVKTRGQSVQVEMIADSSEAKHILEKGISDLKSSLAQHKLSVDQVKVDVSNNPNTGLDQGQKDLERQMAHQFLQDFSKQNQEWRQSFYEIPGASKSASQLEDGPDKVYSAKPKSSSTRRLDVVA